jgi:hypothetical protein
LLPTNIHGTLSPTCFACPPLAPNLHLHARTALERLFSVISDPYSLKGAISIPSDRLSLAGVAPSAAEGLGLRGALRTAAANATALDGAALRAAGEDLVAGLEQRGQAAAAAVNQAVDTAEGEGRALNRQFMAHSTWCTRLEPICV